MATQKKKAAPVAAKAKSKNEPKKAPAKKVTAAKAAPSKTATVKKTVAKSVAPKAAAKKTAPAKKAAPTKKAAPAKNIAAKKTAPIAKKATPEAQKESNPIVKNSPAKKTAKTGATKAVPKKLATPKKTTDNKASAAKSVTPPKKATQAKKADPKKPNAPAAKAPYKGKTVEKVVAEAESIRDHQAQLKKALANKKAKKQAARKSEKPFVMPKVTTDRSRKYEPEFTKSVLDPADIEYSGPTMRYNDNDLVEFRELITKKLETAKKELGYLQGLITRKDQMGGDDTDNRYMTMEDGGLSMEREQLSQMASRQISFIDHLEKAMMRIENKTYGICRVTGKLIDKARLRAVPHATLSIEAKMGINK